jgi:hypothetical protein
MASLRSVFGQREPLSRFGGKMMLYRFTSILALCPDGETANSPDGETANSATRRERGADPGSGRDR